MLATRTQSKSRRPLTSGFPFDALLGTEGNFLQASHETPHMVWTEEADAFVFRAELPGVKQEEIEVQVQDDKVTVSIHAQEGKDASEGSAHRFSGLKRAFRFRTPLNSEKAEATLELGVLRIHLPKTASAVPRSLSIRSV